MDLSLALILALLSYLLGAIPTGYLVGRLAGGVDVLEHGSKRTGATNVLRLLGWRAAGAVFLGDAAKGVAALALVRSATGGDPSMDLLAALAALAGHTFSPFLRFRGGRGVAIGAAMTVVMAPITAVVGTALFVAAIAVTRYVSLGSILAAVSVPPTIGLLVAYSGQPPQHLWYGLLSSALVLFNHRDNISRLRAGTERKLGSRVGPNARNQR